MSPKETAEATVREKEWDAKICVEINAALNTIKHSANNEERRAASEIVKNLSAALLSVRGLREQTASTT